MWIGAGGLFENRPEDTMLEEQVASGRLFFPFPMSCIMMPA